MVLEEGGGGDNHELGDNYSYYVTLIVYLSTKFCNFPNYPGLLFIGQLCLKCVRSKTNSSDQFCSILFRVFCFVSFPCPCWSVFLSIFILFSFVGVCENHRGVFFIVVCVPFLSVFVVFVC